MPQELFLYNNGWGLLENCVKIFSKSPFYTCIVPLLCYYIDVFIKKSKKVCINDNKTDWSVIDMVGSTRREDEVRVLNQNKNNHREVRL